MATTTKFQIVPNSTQTGRTKEEISILKNKITELERQVNEYKIKLDGLRRAKLTTVVKLEKEYINTTSLETSRSEKSKSCEKCEEFEKMIENERKSNTQLTQLIEQNQNLKQQSSTTVINHSNSCQKCEDFKQLKDIEKQNIFQLNQQLENQIKQTEQERNTKQTLQRSLDMFQIEFLRAKKICEKLQKENQDYKNKFDLMKKEHENKMADLLRREEEAKKQVTTWEQMYKEWMTTMERRVHNLQVTDQVLQTWIHNNNNNTMK